MEQIWQMFVISIYHMVTTEYYYCMNYEETAEKYFFSGCNCAQSVIMPFAEKFGVDTEKAFEIGSGLGGGIAGTNQHICGSISGMMVVGGWIFGKWEGQEEKVAMTAFMNELYHKFTDKYNESTCDKLKAKIGKDVISPYTKECFVYVKKAVSILAEYVK